MPPSPHFSPAVPPNYPLTLTRDPHAEAHRHMEWHTFRHVTHTRTHRLTESPMCIHLDIQAHTRTHTLFFSPAAGTLSVGEI